jgi:membrane protein YdbS with pleckstrin-like domain
MSIEQTRAKVIASVWQAIAQSKVDLAAIPQAEQEKLVSKIADTVIVTMNDLLDEVPTAELPIPEGEADEKILWKGRPFLSLVENYVLTSDRLKIVKGLLSRDIENFELIRVQDIDISQGVSERIFGVGDITLRGQDASKPTVVIRNISNPEEVYETIRKAWLDARKRYGLQFREYM